MPWPAELMAEIWPSIPVSLPFRLLLGWDAMANDARLKVGVIA
jgi:hypothetical protein